MREMWGHTTAAWSSRISFKGEEEEVFGGTRKDLQRTKDGSSCCDYSSMMTVVGPHANSLPFGEAASLQHQIIHAKGCLPKTPQLYHACAPYGPLCGIQQQPWLTHCPGVTPESLARNTFTSCPVCTLLAFYSTAIAHILAAPVCEARCKSGTSKCRKAAAPLLQPSAPILHASWHIKLRGAAKSVVIV